MPESILRRLLPVIAIAALLAGCAALGSDEQGNAGITAADLEFCESQEAGKDKYLCGITFRDGKEKDSISLTVKHPSGIEVVYSATAVRAFKAHEVRAAVEEAIAESGKEVLPGVVDAVVKAVTGL